jgi:hypothetical protein
MFIKNHIEEFPVGKICRVMQVSRSGYYKWNSGIVSKQKMYRAYLQLAKCVSLAP